ncbi:PQQ-binding-like beta-propeller repeat protein [Haloarcula japonica]|uniref:Serine/threonine protein kinase-like protein n=1 Tax=Haloarcula japonica (strain ATCC 49778 / DSM 6131 / JCM 7785 / NBRC 101032 / NCIMB 13157 / TR-1) TaxID=1227453 RepID=M0L929_HALJT|nr:PQQ-binding-like beta-propeller repeat protein [Haloarcula japonica]EMA29583.1 serine/threonine protein kinase-like protein [Haloarcula japonica DSM 6131]
MPSSRRRYLRGCAATLGLATAGCLGSNESTEPTPEKTSTATESETGTATPTQTGQTEPFVAWQQSLDSVITAPPISTGSRLYVGTESGTIKSLATVDGSQQWSYDANDPIRSQPKHVRNTVFVISGKEGLYEDHVVVALDAETGAKQWTFAPGEWWLELLGATEDMVYVGTNADTPSKQGQTLYALAVSDGSVQWSGEVGDQYGAVLDNGTIYVASRGRFYAYDTETGEQRWATDVSDYYSQTMVATDGTLCYAADVVETHGTLLGVAADTGETLWTHEEGSIASTTLHDGTLYVGGTHVAALDPTTGEQRWRTDQSGYVKQAPVQNGTLYTGGDVVRGHDSSTGELDWTWRPETNIKGVVPAAVVSDTLYADSWSDGDPRNRFKFALDTNAETKRWAFDVERELTDLSVDEKRAYAAADDTVYALE